MPKAKTTTKKKSSLTQKEVEKAFKSGSAKKRRAANDGARAAVAEARAAAQGCLDAIDAAFIVGSCLLPGMHQNDDTLEQTGLFTEPLRLIFRECVFNGVLDKGCDISRGQIPNGADTTVGAVKQAIANNAT